MSQQSNIRQWWWAGISQSMRQCSPFLVLHCCSFLSSLLHLHMSHEQPFIHHCTPKSTFRFVYLLFILWRFLSATVTRDYTTTMGSRILSFSFKVLRWTTAKATKTSKEDRKVFVSTWMLCLCCIRNNGNNHDPCLIQSTNKGDWHVYYDGVVTTWTAKYPRADSSSGRHGELF